MKINQNKSNLLLKLFTKSFINNKKVESKINNTLNNLEKKKNNKILDSSNILKNSNSTLKNNKKYYLKEKNNTSGDNYQINNKTNQDTIKIKIKNNKKRNVILKKNIVYKKKNENKFILDNDIIKVNIKDSFNNNSFYNNKNKVSFWYNKTINHIRINNPKLNSVLYKKSLNLKNKPINFYFPLKNFNSLNKNKYKQSLNSSMYKMNNSFKEKRHINKYFDSTKLKFKLKKNKSIEKGYLDFYKVNKKLYNKKMNEKKNNLNKKVIQNYIYPIDNGEINNRINTISFSNEILFNEKENEIKSDFKKNSDINKTILDSLKVKLEKIDNNTNKINEPKTEREDIIKIKDKTKSFILKKYSKSVEKRSRRKIINNITKKQKNNIMKLNDVAEKYLIKKSKHKSNNNIIKKSNKLKDINNNKIANNYNTLPKTYKTNSEIFDSQTNKKNSDIFEIISNIKVKSFIEYEEDKKNLLSKKDNNINMIIDIDNDKKETNLTNINNNIKEISISQNYIGNCIDTIENNDDNYINEKFIEDRDEYDIKLKETFSKDRFSFRPTNKDSKETFQDNKHINENNNKILIKNVFLNNDDIIYKNIKYNDISSNSIKTKKIKKEVKNIKAKIKKKIKIQELKKNKNKK